MAVVVSFIVCWLPFHAQRLVATFSEYHGSPMAYMVVTYVSGVFYYLSTCINPLLYSIMSHRFREAFKVTESAAPLLLPLRMRPR